MSRLREAGPLARLALVALLLTAGPWREALGAEQVAAAGADELWRKAVAVVAANDSWKAGLTVLAARETDGRGRARSTWEATIRTTPDAEGTPVQDVVRYVENGKDVTAQRRERAAQTGGGREGGQGSGGGPFSWNPSDPRQTPFHPSVQGRVTVRRLQAEEFVEGRRCAAYSFEQRLEGKSLAKGTAWLDSGSGMPVRLEATFDPLPMFVHQAEIAVGFAGGADGAWLVKHFHATGEATFLMIRRAYTMELELADHWRPPVGPAAR